MTIELTRTEKEIEKLTERLSTLKRKRLDLLNNQRNQREHAEFRFKFYLELTLAADQIWPEGDAPLKPTVDDVWKSIIGDDEHYRKQYDDPVIDILRDWNLILDEDEFLTITKVKTK